MASGRYNDDLLLLIEMASYETDPFRSWCRLKGSVYDRPPTTEEEPVFSCDIQDKHQVLSLIANEFGICPLCEMQSMKSRWVRAKTNGTELCFSHFG